MNPYKTIGDLDNMLMPPDNIDVDNMRHIYHAEDGRGNLREASYFATHDTLGTKTNYILVVYGFNDSPHSYTTRIPTK